MCVTLFLLLFGIFLSSLPLVHECKKLDVCTFQVNSTDFCPSNQTEWKKRSSKMNCSETNAYMCVPNERFTQLVEFCYDRRAILIFKGTCLYFSSAHSDVNVYDCRNFEDGCPSSHYLSSEIYEYPSCIHVEKGCFAADASCKSQPSQRETQLNASTLTISLGVSIPACFLLCMLLFYIIRKRNSLIRRKVRRELEMDRNQRFPLLRYESLEALENYKARRIRRRRRLEMDMEKSLVGFEHRETLETDTESPLEKSIFNQWRQDDFYFISTKACKEVEKKIKGKNLVIVAGQSGSGKSAIIQHIALKYREQGWTVRRVKKVEDIMDEYCSSRFQKYKSMFIFNDPLGKESFDELLNNSWQKYEEKIKLYLKTAKLVMSCRNYIICDARVTHYLLNQSHVVNIDYNKYKLSVDEKLQIFKQYSTDMTLSNKERDKIVDVMRFFPLLCKLYSSKEEYQHKDIRLFTEPVSVLKEELLKLRNNEKHKYCALALLVIFNDDLCPDDLFKYEDTQNKVKHTLELFKLSKDSPPFFIEYNLNSMTDYFVKKIGNTYHFYHDFVMEITTCVFGNDYPKETIMYADIGFLRRRVRLGDCNKHDKSFTVYINDEYKVELGKRLFTELYGERLVDVVLNPCLRDENVLKVIKEAIKDNPENQQMLLKTKKLTIEKQELNRTSKSLLMTKIKFLELENEASPLFALIVFCHTQLSQYCINILQQTEFDLTSCSLVSATCCNGSKELFESAFKDRTEVLLEKTWGCLYPIHIVSVFHNYELLGELIKMHAGVNVNQKTDDEAGWTPLILAAGNDPQENGVYYHVESNAKRRDETVQLLLRNGADINQCTNDKASPLYMACQNGHESTVQLLLNKKADINLCNVDGASPILIACQNGHESVVHLCLQKGAIVNVLKKNGASPLYVACQHGHDSIVHRLLRNGAHINLCNKNGASPLYKACKNGHDSSVHILLRNGANINLCSKNRISPLFIACQNGHDSTVNILLSYGADINLCSINGLSPLHKACQYGHESTVHILLRNGANINLCSKNRISPLFIACQNGHDSTVQLLLNKGAFINLCNENGVSPLYIACQNGHDSIVQPLLRNGANINLCNENGVSPLYIVCQNGHDSTVQLLLSNGADVDLCNEDGASPLYTACQNGHESIVQLLLSKGADVNLCLIYGVSPLYLAFARRCYTTFDLLIKNGANTSLFCGWKFNPDLKNCFDIHDSTVEFLMQKDIIEKNMYDPDSYFSLFVSCQVERVTRMMLTNESV